MKRGASSSSSGAVSSDAFEKHLASCLRTTSVSAYKQTWELNKNPVQLLHDFSIAKRVGPLPLIDFGGDLDVGAPVVVETHLFKLRRTVDMRTWEEKLNVHMVAAIRKWAGIVLSFPLAFDVGRKYFTNHNLVPGGIHEMLKHVFAGKSAGTLHNRANPMLRFIQWCQKRGHEAFPLDEEVCYEFGLSSEHAAPTFLRSFLVSITFGHFILGLTGSEECMASMRLKGVSRESYLKKRKRRQRQPLTAEQVRKMELFVAGDIPGRDGDRLGAWFFLLCVYMRARYSDGLNLSDLVVDCPEPDHLPPYGFLEGCVGRTKTSYTTEKKTMNLPMVALRRGLSGCDWISVGLRMRQSLPFAIEAGVPLLPAPGRQGWQPSPLTAGQAGLWLRGILCGLGENPSSVTNVGTHSCKSTCSSWCSKAGVPLEVRRLLGYHSGGRDTTTLCYSRDAMSGPLAALQEVVDDVASGALMPDHTRSGYRVPVRIDNEAGSASAGGNSATDGCDQPSEHSDSDSSDSEDSLDEEDQDLDRELDREAESAVVPPWSQREGEVFNAFLNQCLVRHRYSSMFHLVMDEGGTHLKCGKPITSNYDMVTDEPKFVYPMCSVCFR